MDELGSNVDSLASPLDFALLGGPKNDIADFLFLKARLFCQSGNINAFFGPFDDVQNLSVSVTFLAFLAGAFLAGFLAFFLLAAFSFSNLSTALINLSV